MPKKAGKDKWETNGKMLDLKSTIWIFTLNVNSLNIFFLKQIVSDWIKKQEKTMDCLTLNMKM